MAESQKCQWILPPHRDVEDFFLFHKQKNLEKIIHILQSTFPQKPVEKYGLFVLCVNVRFDIFNDLGQVGIVFHSFFHTIDGMQYGGMITVAKFTANVI